MAVFLCIANKGNYKIDDNNNNNKNLTDKKKYVDAGNQITKVAMVE